MTNSLRISLVQSKLIWGNVEENLNNFTQLLAPLKEKTDLIVLPEMFTSGFLMEGKQEIAKKASESLGWMHDQAGELNAILLGSMIVEEDGQFYNRIYCVDGKNVLGSYDKRHLYRMGEEHLHFVQGQERIVFNIGKWRICPLVCYDLRFPVWSRNNNDYDLLLFVANWPQTRTNIWDTLLRARAIENQSYVAGVNRIGTDGTGLGHAGGSVLIDAKGRIMAKCVDHQEEIITMELSLSKLTQFREKFPVHLDADSFQIL